jgi:hypothetical protein
VDAQGSSETPDPWDLAVSDEAVHGLSVDAKQGGELIDGEDRMLSRGLVGTRSGIALHVGVEARKDATGVFVRRRLVVVGFGGGGRRLHLRPRSAAGRDRPRRSGRSQPILARTVYARNRRRLAAFVATETLRFR